MQLIGMLDSPYVRRAAVSMLLLGLRFEHRPLSVFRTFDEFRRINPVVKAPTLVCDDDEVLLDSTLILQYAQALAPARRLMPQGTAALRHELRLVGLALAACEKAVQVIYEHQLRPAEKRHAPWLERVAGQMRAAFDEIEREVARRPPAATGDAIAQGGVDIAVAWRFAQLTLPEPLPTEPYPAIAAHSARAEALPEFAAAPHGDGTVRAG